MPFDTTAAAPAPALPVQFIDIKITPLPGDAYALEIGATFLDEENLEFVGQDLVSERVATLDHVLALIAKNLNSAPAASRQQGSGA